MSPRHVPATVHELTRVGMLSGLPGEHLTRLAERMERQDVAPGEGERFTYQYDFGDSWDHALVVEKVLPPAEGADRPACLAGRLSGLLNVTQEDLGERRLLRPGDAFGEVALAMGIPRTASVRALTPAVVASCDQAAFDELLRPLFADE